MSLSGSERSFLDEAAAADDYSRTREADILADRIRSSGLVDRDSELALLLLLVAADEYRPTDAVIGGLRQALVRHRLTGRVPLPGAMTTALAVGDGCVAVADIGTNTAVRMSTRPKPLAPVAQCRITIWGTLPVEIVRTFWLNGRTVGALDLRRNTTTLQLAAGIDDQVVLLDVVSGAVLNVGGPLGSQIHSLSLSRDTRRVLVQTTNEAVVIDVLSGKSAPLAVMDVINAAEPEVNAGTDFGISEATLHNWLKKADIEDGARPGVTEKEAAELRDARKRIRLLEQENEILRRAVAFFARELPQNEVSAVP